MEQFRSKLSVIIPVFNCEKYISRCLDSLIESQPYEIIIVDDFSTDGSKRICEKYADSFANINLLCNSKNRGVTYTKYTGLCHARGKYVTFVDADDWVEGSFFKQAEQFMEENGKVDIVVGKMINDDAGGKQKCIIDFPDERLLDRQNALEELFLWNMYRWEMCGKIYRRTLFDSWMPDYSIKVCEDLDCTWQVFQNANNVLALPVDFYHYYVNENSATNTMNYIDNNSYRVFERILSEKRLLGESALRIAEKHYVLSLVNIIRTLILQESKDGEIIKYQKKAKIILEGDTSGLYDAYANIFQSPQMAKNALKKVEAEICELANELLLKENSSKSADGSSNKIYLYGIGVVAKTVGFLLGKNGYYSFEYVVSDDQFKYKIFENRKVHYLKDLDYNDKIILTLNTDTQRIIKERLQTQGFLYVYGMNLYGTM